MIAHALYILQKELDAHLGVYDTGSGNGNTTDRVIVANMAEGFDGGGGGEPVTRDKIVVGMVNIREEKALKNLPNYVRNDVTLRATYENPPVYINLLLLFTATHKKYDQAVLYISRVIQFFQSRNFFTQDTVSPTLLQSPGLQYTDYDLLETFNIILDLYSPGMEEVNHLWGTLGSKQYPFVLYTMRMLDLKFRAVHSERGLITEVVNDFYHKKSTN